ncbi:FadR/GntR family transcriptional regulator [Paenarthrobacter sp. NPDC056912]|uniref:FadR/GntR family transcriptional regulator n=1 Tax=Paenarthrobacter sp. NPDC056912 TaxID=3345965 RepID=UPI00366C3670
MSSISIANGPLSEQLSERLIRMIADGELSAGDKLPNERELAETAGISRTSVREALRDLELRGLISRKPGRGTIVEAQSRPELHAAMLGTMESSQRTLREVMDLRAVIEPPMAERAALRARGSELSSLLRPLELAEAELRRDKPSMQLLVRLDVEFHSGVAKLTQNPMLVKLLDVANEWMAPSRETTHQTMKRIAKSVAAHRRIYDAIRRHEADEAREAMSGHIHEVSTTIGIDTWDPDTPIRKHNES